MNLTLRQGRSFTKYYSSHLPVFVALGPDPPPPPPPTWCCV